MKITKLGIEYLNITKEFWFIRSTYINHNGIDGNSNRSFQPNETAAFKCGSILTAKA